jgi:hypothetical protein
MIFAPLVIEAGCHSLPADTRSYVGSKTLVVPFPFQINCTVREVLTYVTTGFSPQTAVSCSLYS